MAAALALALAACASAPDGESHAGTDFWADLAAGRHMSLSAGRVEVTGYVLKAARLSVTLFPSMPEKLPDGTYDRDFNHCVALLLSDEQYARVETGARLRVRGEFGVRRFNEGGAVVTTPSIRDRRAAPRCTAAKSWNEALLLYAEEVETMAP
ncbi:MAG TPA: hypothetical protein VEA60_06805 [Allosphingosinicella sp.]|nr:hypothetical protein [Allosphingosinicella sp.]